MSSNSSRKIKISYVNNEGGGFADTLEVSAGITLEAFFANHATGNSRDYDIKVNHMVQPADYVLKTGDRVTITPRKYAGA